MRIAWVTRSFLDYRIPVCRALDALTGGQLHLVYSGDYVPRAVQEKAQGALGPRAIGLRGEWKLGPEDRAYMANRNFSLRFQPGLLKMIRQLRPDVMVCDGFFKWTFLALQHRIRHGTPLVVLYERTAYTERHAQWIRTFYRKFVLRFTDAMSCNGRLCKEYTVSMGFPAERITLGHMAADTDGMAQSAARVPQTEIQLLRESWLAPSALRLAPDTLRPAPDASRPAPCAQGLVFLYVGRLNKGKGIAELLKAWEIFTKAEIPPPSTDAPSTSPLSTAPLFTDAPSTTPPRSATLVLVGSGPAEAALRHQSSVLRLPNVHFAGSVDYDKLAPYYAAADAFIIPTLEDNWSLVVPEAMACGLPILCSKYNGCWPELVHEGRNGWVFDPLDTADTAKRLAQCAQRHAQGAGAEAGTDARTHRRTEAPAITDQFQHFSVSASHLFPSTALRAMGQESREILKDHTPHKAAEAIHRACEIAIEHRGRSCALECEKGN
ncbi:MAG TPA: glycosyltransferase family 4 protein [Candidatus Paceibacterota bacterium]|nr:glycosyltransferase family 4 protein [Verrucomicrobiota bacterium]HSA12693.1 glycosyltransferase family 4 protein [Candidatus Paceibacterota bacterium]